MQLENASNWWVPQKLLPPKNTQERPTRRKRNWTIIDIQILVYVHLMISIEIKTRFSNPSGSCLLEIKVKIKLTFEKLLNSSIIS